MDDLIPLAPFIMVIAIVVIPSWLKSRDRREMQATLRTAIEKGQTLPPDLVEALTKQEVKKPASAAKDMRTGVIMISIAVGLSLMGYFISMADRDAFYPIMGVATIPGMIGLAFVVLSFFNKNKD